MTWGYLAVQAEPSNPSGVTYHAPHPPSAEALRAEASEKLGPVVGGNLTVTER